MTSLNLSLQFLIYNYSLAAYIIHVASENQQFTFVQYTCIDRNMHMLVCLKNIVKEDLL